MTSVDEVTQYGRLFRKAARDLSFKQVTGRNVSRGVLSKVCIAVSRRRMGRGDERQIAKHRTRGFYLCLDWLVKINFCKIDGAKVPVNATSLCTVVNVDNTPYRTNILYCEVPN